MGLVIILHLPLVLIRQLPAARGEEDEHGCRCAPVMCESCEAALATAG
ncbi:MAG: hypothetical protein M3O34_16055 [Chloroflexota bacterium]|nr:hypothetical protein [Chloroflexota bacterium]